MNICQELSFEPCFLALMCSLLERRGRTGSLLSLTIFSVVVFQTSTMVARVLTLMKEVSEVNLDLHHLTINAFLTLSFGGALR